VVTEPSSKQLAERTAELEGAIADLEELDRELAPIRPVGWGARVSGRQVFGAIVALIVSGSLYFPAGASARDAHRQAQATLELQAGYQTRLADLLTYIEGAESKVAMARRQTELRTLALKTDASALHADWQEVAFGELGPDDFPAAQWTLVGIASCFADRKGDALVAATMLQYLAAVPYGSLENQRKAKMDELIKRRPRDASPSRTLKQALKSLGAADRLGALLFMTCNGSGVNLFGLAREAAEEF
jgi:hypothetical protein